MEFKDILNKNRITEDDTSAVLKSLGKEYLAKDLAKDNKAAGKRLLIQ